MHDKMTDTTPAPEEIIAFLDGSGPLEGVWFGDRPKGERGGFWWRKYLPRLRSSPPGVSDITGTLPHVTVTTVPSPPGGVDGELLAALKAVAPYFEGEHHPDHPHCRQLRAAIAKAEATPRYDDEVTDEQIARIKAHVGPLPDNLEVVSPAPAAEAGEREVRYEEIQTVKLEGCDPTVPAAPYHRVHVGDRCFDFDTKQEADNLIAAIATLLRSPAPGVGEEELARILCEVDGRDPDGHDIMFICTADNQPLPCWMGYMEQASAVHARITTEQRGNG